VTAVLSQSATVGVPPALTRVADGAESPSRAIASSTRAVIRIPALMVPSTETITIRWMTRSPWTPNSTCAAAPPTNGSFATRAIGSTHRDAAFSSR
jgi:hypothetical protein